MDRDLQGQPGVIAVAGEALIDLVPAGRQGLFEAVPGGSPANVAVGLARLDVPTRMLARIAGDSLGERIRAHLAGNRVDLSFAVHAAEPSSLAIVTVGQDGVVDYDFRVQGTADWQWRDQELTSVLDAQVVALHAGSLALALPPGADVLRRLLARARRTVTISYDPNCRPLLMGSPERRGCCQAAHRRRSSPRGSPRDPRSSRSPLDPTASWRPRSGRAPSDVRAGGSRSWTPSAPATPS